MGEVLNFLHQIDEKQLDKRHYMESLIEQAFSCSFLSEADIARIQSELLGILAAQFDKWSHGESSSLPTEKAQEMMTSILFVISIKLKTYPFLEDAVCDLKTFALLVPKGRFSRKRK